MKWVLWPALLLAVGFALDRLLLYMESRGWIFYRRTAGVRGRAMYHAQELDAIFNPGMEHVHEAHFHEEEEAQESGDPPADDRTDTP